VLARLEAPLDLLTALRLELHHLAEHEQSLLRVVVPAIVALVERILNRDQLVTLGPLVLVVVVAVLEVLVVAAVVVLLAVGRHGAGRRRVCGSGAARACDCGS
jgi:hypothetical protein